MQTSFHIAFKKPGTIALRKLTYVIIGAREDQKWIFVRHKDRQSWELPAGHIEKNETAEEAAHRELFEETGCSKAKLTALSDYSADNNGTLLHGRIFLAEIIERGPLPGFEIEEIHIAQISPQPATYPEAHNEFLDFLEKHLSL